jgi:hypothetical protein
VEPEAFDAADAHALAIARRASAIRVRQSVSADAGSRSTGKEGVDGSSPSEGFAKFLQFSSFCLLN